MLGLLMGLAAAAGGPTDADTRAWWATTAELSNDAMQGRDTGTEAYARAAKLVADRFAKAGLKPAGEQGGWFQEVPMAQVEITRAEVAIGGRPLRFLHDLTIAAGPSMPTTLTAPIAFRGYCGADALGDVRGKAVVCWGTHRAGLPDEAARVAAVRAGGAAALITVADPGFTVEPPRWPFAYARTVWFRQTPPAAEPMVRMTYNADALAKLMVGSGQDAAALTVAGSAGRPLPSVDLPGRLTMTLTLARKDIASPNVLAVLPGTDPSLADQAILLSAHLDGYGPGEPVNGDGLYNGTLDDAAYVALLIRLAERRAGKGFARPVIFAAWTGEEKGLLGSRWYVAHPTRPLAATAGVINLDQLRPIFPLKRLTVHALDDTTLGADARVVANGMGVAVQKDPEPERNLLRRTDHWPFMQAGVPGTSFVFGYTRGTESERIYRQWYKTGYHKPQDDLNQPMNWQAAADFNLFFYGLVERVADKAEAPVWTPGSPLAPKR